jgi:REP element-mobilizing transposase RayT
LLGDIHEGILTLSDLGKIASQCWDELPQHFPNVHLDERVVMPDHFHAIVWIDHHPNPNRRVDACVDRPTIPDDRPTTPVDRQAIHHCAITPVERPRGPGVRSIAAIVGSFKSTTTRAVRRKTSIPDLPVWQRKYHDRIIRSDEELNRIRLYILDNPLRSSYSYANVGAIHESHPRS